MFGILFLYLIGKYFYKLAEENSQNKWLYAVLGIVIYYFGVFLGGFILGFIFLIADFDFDWDNNTLNNLIAIPFGFTADYLFYSILKKRWLTKIEIKDEIQDIGKEVD